jgi:hypothetical protein
MRTHMNTQFCKHANGLVGVTWAHQVNLEKYTGQTQVKKRSGPIVQMVYLYILCLYIYVCMYTYIYVHII